MTKDVNAVLTNSAVDDIKRLFTQQISPIVFLTQLPHPIFVRIVHTITQVTPQLGKTIRLDGKMVGFFETTNYPTSFMTAPEHIFRTFKVRVPPPTTLRTLRELASGNENELFTHDINYAEVEARQFTPIPFEWANYFLEKDMTPSASLTFVQQALNEVIITNTVAFDPLLSWLRVASCKEKGNQRSTTDTPTTTH